MYRIFMILLFFKAARYLLPWIAGFLVSVIFIAMVPLPPLSALIFVVVVTTWIAWAIETKVFRAFERGWPNPYHPEDPRLRYPRRYRR